MKKTVMAIAASLMMSISLMAQNNAQDNGRDQRPMDKDAMIKQRTEQMVKDYNLTEEQAATHPMRNYITRAVGTEEDIQVDLIEMERQRGDRWLVCSDGLHGMVPKERLKELLSEDDLNDGADQMIRDLGCTPNFLHYQGFPATVCVSVNDAWARSGPPKASAGSSCNSFSTSAR